jgi:hypothetical protein
MKNVAAFGLLVTIIMTGSCAKDNTGPFQNQFIKSFSSDYEMATLTSFQLDDGNYLLASFDQLNIQPGQLLKIDANGNKIWEKQTISQMKIMWNAFPMPGKGFVTFGIKNYDERAMYICLYDNDGQLLSTDSIVTIDRNFQKTPYTLLRLSNGNYVITGGTGFGAGAFNIRILNPQFKQIASRQYTASGNGLIYCKAVCEMPDSTIAIIATVSISNGDRKHLYFIKSDFSAKIITAKFIDDGVNSETANAVIPDNDGLIAVTGKMTGFSFGNDISQKNNDGVAVNYYGTWNDVGRLISGTTNLIQFSQTGQINSTKTIRDYPNNGMMNSIRKTNDGGYIVCGTVNQLSVYLAESDLKIYLLKLDANLDKQWSVMINTVYHALGVDAVQTPDNGYLITGFHKTLNRRFEAMIIKTDENGNY